MTRFPLGVTRHRFEEAGSFVLSCSDDEDVATTIVVAEPAKEEAENKRLHPLLYTHVALMAAAFGVLLPVAAFLYYHGVSLGYKVLLPIVMVLATCGFVLVVVYVQLTSRKHFHYFIHGVVGVALVALVLLGMPLLLVHQKLRVFHFRLGHAVAFFGMGNVLLGLTILPTSTVITVALFVIYGLWLVLAIAFYVFHLAKKKGGGAEKKKTIVAIPLEMNGGPVGHKDSCTSESSHGPQALTRSVISEAKMIQLRKKSMDFLEAHKHMKQLNAELGIKHTLVRDLEDEDEGFKVRMERKDSKSDQDLASHSSPESDDAFPSLDQTRLKRQSSTSDEEEVGGAFNSDTELEKRAAHSSSSINRASTFNYGARFTKKDATEQAKMDSDTSERGGSLRITRHSKRARGKMDHIFKKSDDQPLLKTEEEEESPPSFNITPCTPPIHHAMLDFKPAEESTDSALTQSIPLRGKISRSPTPQMQPAPARRRRAGMASVDSQPDSSGQLQATCPFHTPRTSPRPCRRNASPAGSSAAEEGVSPRPRKKVSVAQIEATFVPPSPMRMEPPRHMSRSPSFNATRSHDDAFADNAFRSIMQISLDAICCANSVGDIVFWSVGACKMFGYTPGEAIGSSLEMIIPQNYKERHRNGISKRTTNTLKYIRKHNYTPEEQKHARLYEVHGVTKGGHEFPVEVNVTSFVLDGEMFYTGVISEVAKVKSSNRNSISSANDLNEVAMKQRALAVGAQMKIAHNLRSAEHISQRELGRVLKGSLGTSFEVNPHDMDQMIDGIMKAGDPEDTGAISFVGLIQLISKHQLYISESGLIARYGKTKSAAESSTTQNRGRHFRQDTKEFVYGSMNSLVWILLYVALNLLLFAIGVGVYSRREELKDSWRLWAFGTGPVLSMNCVLILLPTLSSLVHAMRGSIWMAKLFPLTKPVLFHVVIAIGLLFWTVVHLITHLCSFGLDPFHDNFRNGIKTNVFPTVTGFIVLVVVAVMSVSSIKFLRAQFRFIPFKVLHWVGSALFYVLLLVHGVSYWNPNFWKWLLPALIIFFLERLYKHVVIRTKKVTVNSAGRYDCVSRTAIVELAKPENFDYEPGQYILLNLPMIGQFEWQPCPVSSGPKEEKLTIHIPFTDNIWFKKAFEYLKKNPHNMVTPGRESKKSGEPPEKNARLSQVDMESNPRNQLSAYFSGPYGPIENSRLLFKYKICTVVCGGEGPPMAKAIIKKFLNYRKAINCHCGCQPSLSKLYFVWVIPSGNDFEWFTDYLSELCEDEHLHRYLDIRVFLTNCDSAPDELASALLQLGLKTAGDKVTARRPSQPQLNNLYHMTSYGVPDFASLLDYVASQHSALWMDKQQQQKFGVFTVGELKHSRHRDLQAAIKKSSKPGQLKFKQHHIR